MLERLSVEVLDIRNCHWDEEQKCIVHDDMDAFRIVLRKTNGESVLAVEYKLGDIVWKAQSFNPIIIAKWVLRSFPEVEKNYLVPMIPLVKKIQEIMKIAKKEQKKTNEAMWYKEEEE